MVPACQRHLFVEGFLVNFLIVAIIQLLSVNRTTFYGGYKSNDLIKSLIVNGAPERIRTSDTRLRKPVLYPAELRALRRV